MILDRNIESYVIHLDASLSAALRKISAQKGRILFGVDHKNFLHGALTNGDLIRWLVEQDSPVDLEAPVANVLNVDFSFATTSDKTEFIESLLDTFLFVPIVDEQNRLVSVARRRTIKDRQLVIEGTRISDTDPCWVIAEIGNNHNGSLDRAKRLILSAKELGADCAKFQMRDMDSLYANKGDAADASENLGSQYTLDLLSRFQLAPDEMIQAFEYTREVGLTPLCTPWDTQSLNRLEEYGMSAYKVASADLTNVELIQRLIETGKPIIMSTGMSRENEIIQATKMMRDGGSQFALLHCNSTYPPPFKDVNLNYIGRLAEIGECLVGYSGHERDIFVAIAAVSKGARIIEKHFTEDRDLEGNDHKVSLLPDEFKRMVDGIRQVEEALGSSQVRTLSQGEMMNRVTLAKSLFTKMDLHPGDLVEDDMIEVRSPGQGLQPNHRSELVGRRIQRKMTAGDVFYESDLAEKQVAPSKYKFSRPWGLPVRFHDYKKLAGESNPGFLEFHLSYKDLELDLKDYFSEVLDYGLVVHSPELFEGDHTLDLCTPDSAYRQLSIAHLQNVIRVTRDLKKYFQNSSNDIGIVTNVGGFSESAPLSEKECEARRLLLGDSLSQLDTEGVQIWPQTEIWQGHENGGEGFWHALERMEDFF